MGSQQQANMSEGLPWNFSWALTNILAGTSCPEVSSELIALEKKGISLLVTLSPDTRPPSFKHVDHMKNKNFFIEEFTGADVSLLTQVVDTIAKEIADNGRVAVHCRAGNGRTGMVLAAYFIKYQNYTAPDAIRHIRTLRRFSIETQEQEESLREFENYLKALGGRSPPENSTTDRSSSRESSNNKKSANKFLGGCFMN